MNSVIEAGNRESDQNRTDCATIQELSKSFAEYSKDQHHRSEYPDHVTLPLSDATLQPLALNCQSPN